MQPQVRDAIVLAPLKASDRDDLSGQTIDEITGKLEVDIKLASCHFAASKEKDDECRHLFSGEHAF
jgi:hypothetical protein